MKKERVQESLPVNFDSVVPEPNFKALHNLLSIKKSTKSTLIENSGTILTSTSKLF